MTKDNVFLKALTPESEKALGVKLYRISKFPFRVGRECRRQQAMNYQDSRRRMDSIPNNDLYLIEMEDLLNVSREHFQIEWNGDSFILVDRGSACGTLVEGVNIGGERKGGQRPLHNGDVIIVGTSNSQFIFKFVLNSRSDGSLL
jgi:pSer/pThr/pTyr-binding forkhead associated (FHA) protein